MRPEGIGLRGPPLNRCDRHLHWVIDHAIRWETRTGANWRGAAVQLPIANTGNNAMANRTSAIETLAAEQPHATLDKNNEGETPTSLALAACGTSWIT